MAKFIQARSSGTQFWIWWAGADLWKSATKEPVDWQGCWICSPHLCKIWVQICWEWEKKATDWDYLLNVRPNKNESTSEFWQRLFIACWPRMKYWFFDEWRSVIDCWLVHPTEICCVRWHIHICGVVKTILSRNHSKWMKLFSCNITTIVF